MDILTIALLVLAILALSGWGVGYYVARPAVGPVVEPAPSSAPLVHIVGIIGIGLLIGFAVLMITGWRFGLHVQAPW